MDVFSTELIIRLSFVKTLELRGFKTPNPHPIRHCRDRLVVQYLRFPQSVTFQQHSIFIFIITLFLSKGQADEKWLFIMYRTENSKL
jgi:hypothetical protein